MGTCQCVSPARLHILPAGVHLPDGRASDLVLVDEAWSDSEPRCTVCALLIESTFFRCRPCGTIICRPCVAGDTLIVECDCEVPVMVTGVQLAASRAAAQLAR